MSYSGSPAMYVGTDGSGGYQVDTILTQKVFHAFQPKSTFRSFLAFRENLGKNAGDTVYRNLWGNIDTAGAAVAESATIPTDRKMAVTQATATVTEFGNSISFHSKLADLANIDVTDPIIVGLRNDEAKGIDSYLYTNVYNAALYRYIGTSTSGYALTSNGTATATNTSVMNAYHVRQIVMTLKGMYVPPLGDGKYAAICSLLALDNMRTDSEWKNMVYYEDSEASTITGYVGTFQGVHFYEQHNAIDNAIGSGSPSGEAFFLGAQYGTEDLVLPANIRTNYAIAMQMGSAADFGRKLEAAWYEMAAFGTIRNADGACSCVKWDSAA